MHLKTLKLLCKAIFTKYNSHLQYISYNEPACDRLKFQHHVFIAGKSLAGIYIVMFAGRYT